MRETAWAGRSDESTTISGFGFHAGGNIGSYTGDGLIASPYHRPARLYRLAQLHRPPNLSRRLIQEVVTIGTTNYWTNTFTYDGGTTGGLGVITRAGQPIAAQWQSGKAAADALSRINTETNSVATASRSRLTTRVQWAVHRHRNS